MSLQGQITSLNQWANESRLILWELEDDIDNRTISAYHAQQHDGIGWVVISLREVMKDFIEAMQWFVYGYSSSFNYSYWLGVHQGLFDKEVDITWRAICEAWVANDFEGKEWTIAIIDRMRQLMWDEPFSIRWAANPKTEH